MKGTRPLDNNEIRRVSTCFRCGFTTSEGTGRLRHTKHFLSGTRCWLCCSARVFRVFHFRHLFN